MRTILQPVSGTFELRRWRHGGGPPPMPGRRPNSEPAPQSPSGAARDRAQRLQRERGGGAVRPPG